MHKEAYFSPENVKEQSQEILLRLESYRRRRVPPFKPGLSALLVLDMQDYFLHPHSHAYIPSGPAILPGVKLLQEAYKRIGLRVIFTRHINTVEDSRQMSTWWREIITLENPLSAISPQFERTGSDCIEKSQYDAFFNTRLDEILRAGNIEQVVICGVMTHLCCETTARSAFMRGFEVFFTVDGTATYNLELHLASLRTLAHGFATPVLVSQLLSELEV